MPPRTNRVLTEDRLDRLLNGNWGRAVFSEVSAGQITARQFRSPPSDGTRRVSASTSAARQPNRSEISQSRQQISASRNRPVHCSIFHRVTPCSIAIGEPQRTRCGPATANQDKMRISAPSAPPTP